MPTYTERKFETHIEQQLNQSGYRSLLPTDYNKFLCLIPDEVLQFIRGTQPKIYERLERQYSSDTPKKLITRLCNEVASRGVLDVLRKGIKDRGCYFNLTYFQPSSGMNPDHQRLYAQNRFALIRQLNTGARKTSAVKGATMVQSLNIPAKFPNLNEVIAASKSHWSGYHKLKAKFTTPVAILAKSRLKPVMGKAFFFFEWRAEDRRTDPDNIAAGGCKMILDGLVEAGILEGDGWRHVSGFSDSFAVDKESPGITVRIFETGEERLRRFFLDCVKCSE